MTGHTLTITSAAGRFSSECSCGHWFMSSEDRARVEHGHDVHRRYRSAEGIEARRHAATRPATAGDIYTPTYEHGI